MIVGQVSIMSEERSMIKKRKRRKKGTESPQEPACRSKLQIMQVVCNIEKNIWRGSCLSSHAKKFPPVLSGSESRNLLIKVEHGGLIVG